MNKPIIPNAAIDCVIFGFDLSSLKVLLVRPDGVAINGEKGPLALPGGFIHDGELIDQAAARLVNHLTGSQNVFMQQFYSLITNHQVPRQSMGVFDSGSVSASGKLISIVYYALVDLSENSACQTRFPGEVFWRPADDMPALIPGQAEIIRKAFSIIRSEIKQKPLAFELLPVKFTLSQLQRLYEVVIGTTYDKRNFRRKIMQTNYVIPIVEKQTNVSHKPARLFMFSRDTYERNQVDGPGFCV